MKLNATLVHAIVSDVPREAWPDGIEYAPAVDACDSEATFTIGVGWDDSASGRVLGDAQVHHAVMLFEASMARWLMREGYHSFIYELWDCEVSLTLDAIKVTLPIDGSDAVPSTFRLLAAACKAVPR